MANVTYTALRNISSGHVSGTEYPLDFTASRLQRSVRTNNRTPTSLDGSTEVIRYASKVTWDVVVNELEEADMPQWREFLESTDGGETFDFDAYGTDFVPDNVLLCELDTNRYTESRIRTTGYYNLRFRVRVV